MSILRPDIHEHHAKLWLSYPSCECSGEVRSNLLCFVHALSYTMWNAHVIWFSHWLACKWVASCKYVWIWILRMHYMVTRACLDELQGVCNFFYCLRVPRLQWSRWERPLLGVGHWDWINLWQWVWLCCYIQGYFIWCLGSYGGLLGREDLKDDTPPETSAPPFPCCFNLLRTSWRWSWCSVYMHVVLCMQNLWMNTSWSFVRGSESFLGKAGVVARDHGAGQ